jgi:tripartite-type tricarboxylate transporter receptor subunit TctC
MYGSAGIGTPPHVFVEQMKAATGLPMGHVPFKGSPGLVQALVGGHIQVGMEGPGVLLPLIQTGKVRPLAISGDARMDLLPDVPTFEELGIPEIGVSWLAVLAPKGTLPEAVEALNRELSRVLALPDLRQEWGTLGRQIGGGSPEILAERIRTELPRWRGIIESAGIRPE